eukprot:SAG11_NODE_15377_length_580_cov_0.983368_1_plen_25_part_01
MRRPRERWHSWWSTNLVQAVVPPKA